MAAQRNRPTSWITRTPVGDIKTTAVKPAKRDPFPTWLLLIGLAAIVLMVAARRWTIPFFLTLAVIGWTLTINWLPDEVSTKRIKHRKPIGVWALIATWATLGASWPWAIRVDLWHAISWACFLGLGVWSATVVGRSHLSEKAQLKRQEAWQDTAWPDRRKLICAPGTSKVSYVEHKDDKGEVTREVLTLHNPNGNPFNAAEVARAIDNQGRGGKGYPPGSTRFAKGGTEGHWVFTTELRKPWTVIPTMPTDVNDKGEIPIGYDKWGDIVWLGGDIHVLVAGETDSGKSSFLELLATWEQRRHRELRFIDPKRVEFGAWRKEAADYANSFTGALGVLERLVAEMDRRSTIMEQRGWKKWTPANAPVLGPRITCFIDETSDLFDATEVETDDKGKKRKIDVGEQCASASVRLARVARAMGITVVFAAQYPTADSVPAAIKQNTPVTVCLRVKNGTAVRVALGEDVKPGSEFDMSQPQPQGRATVDMPGVGKRLVQLFQAPAKVAAGAPLPAPTRPATPPWPSPSVRSVRPPSGCTEQGEQATDRRTADNPTDATLKGLEAKLWPELNGHPRTNKELADVIGASTSGTHDALKRLRDKGLAVFAGDGWQRASASPQVIDS